MRVESAGFANRLNVVSKRESVKNDYNFHDLSKCIIMVCVLNLNRIS